MNDRRLRVLLVGFAGTGSQDHQSSMYLPALQQHSGFDIVGVVPLEAPDGQVRAARAAQRLKVPVIEALADGLARSDVDAVSVCANPQARVGVITEAMLAGKAVLADKPLAMSAPEVGELDRVRAATGCVLAVAHHQRFQPMLQAAATALAAGRVGLPWHIQGDFLVAGGSPCPDGELQNLGVYPVDVLLSLTGQRINRVYALRVAADGHAGQDLVMLSLDHDNGLTSTLVVGRTGPRAGVREAGLALHRYRISGSHGTALLDATKPALAVQTPTSSAQTWVGPDSVARLLDDWHAAVVDGRPCAVSTGEALHVMDVLAAAARSLTSGQPEAVSPATAPEPPVLPQQERAGGLSR